jgi:hypothetical protein
MKAIFLCVIAFWAISVSPLLAQTNLSHDTLAMPISPFRSAIKIRPLSPLFGFEEIGYERANIKNAPFALEGALAFYHYSLLAAMFQPYISTQIGGKVRIGGKYYFGSQTVKTKGLTLRHPLQGKYLKIEFNGGVIEKRYVSRYGSPSEPFNLTRFQFQTLGILGYQQVGKRICMDMFIGVGLSYSSFDSSSSASFYSSQSFNDRAAQRPYVMEGGIKLGYMFKHKK